MFTPGERIVILHAHPDDETLSTGALIAGLIEDGHPVAVVTATRGERGEVMPGLAALSGPAFVAQRACELRRALEDLSVTDRAWLGTPPARAGGLPPRRYLDSGMRWVTDTVAGPGDDAGPTSLSLAPRPEAAADVAAYLDWYAADVLISYDEHGGYGHPDHVACHHIAAAAAATRNVRFVEIVSEDRLDQPGVVKRSHPEQTRRLRRALASYPSQFRVDGDTVIHVGGQRQPITTDCWLREVE
jgi:N-acetyl-1-D-myo-inositol-2-amino-2-deoxy-alpha-D-glucopyranoside deacetylase